MEFKLHSKYKPTGDQPQAIEQLVKGFKEGNQFETLLGVTGSGKRLLPWLMSLQHSISLHLSYRTIRHWRGSSMVR